MSAKAWFAAGFFTFVIVLVVAVEAPTTKASGWPHDLWLFIPSLLGVVFCGGFLVYGAISDRNK